MPDTGGDTGYTDGGVFSEDYLPRPSSPSEHRRQSTMTPLRIPDQSIQQQTELEKAFEELANQWRADTAFLSSVSKMATHPAYQQIIEMGPAVVPLILRELERGPDHW